MDVPDGPPKARAPSALLESALEHGLGLLRDLRAGGLYVLMLLVAVVPSLLVGILIVALVVAPAVNSAAQQQVQQQSSDGVDEPLGGACTSMGAWALQVQNPGVGFRTFWGAAISVRTLSHYLFLAVFAALWRRSSQSVVQPWRHWACMCLMLAWAVVGNCLRMQGIGLVPGLPVWRSSPWAGSAISASFSASVLGWSVGILLPLAPEGQRCSACCSILQILLAYFLLVQVSNLLVTMFFRNDPTWFALGTYAMVLGGLRPILVHMVLRAGALLPGSNAELQAFLGTGIHVVLCSVSTVMQVGSSSLGGVALIQACHVAFETYYSVGLAEGVTELQRWVDPMWRAGRWALALVRRRLPCAAAAGPRLDGVVPEPECAEPRRAERRSAWQGVRAPEEARQPADEETPAAERTLSLPSTELIVFQGTVVLTSLVELNALGISTAWYLSARLGTVGRHTLPAMSIILGAEVLTDLATAVLVHRWRPRGASGSLAGVLRGVHPAVLLAAWACGLLSNLNWMMMAASKMCPRSSGGGEEPLLNLCKACSGLGLGLTLSGAL